MYNYLICLFILVASHCIAYEYEDSYDYYYQEPEVNLTTVCSTKECYTPIDLLGEGSFGKVYSVVDSQGTIYAMKSYKDQSWDYIELLETFGSVEREYERGQLLNHPNIIRSYDFFKSDIENGEQNSNLVLQYVDGKPIYKVKHPELSKETAITASLELIDAMRYALSFDLLYLDLHEGNIMLDKNNKIMVIDLASFFDFEEIEKYFFNKPTYTSKYAKKQAISIKEKKLEKFFQHPKVKQLIDKNVKNVQVKSQGTGSLNLSRNFFAVAHFYMVTEFCFESILCLSDISDEQLDTIGDALDLIYDEMDEAIERGEKIDYNEYFDKFAKQFMLLKDQ